MYEKGGTDIEDLREAGVPEDRIRELAGDDIEGGVEMVPPE